MKKKILINLLLAFCVFIGSFYLMNIALKVITQHNKEFKLPDFTNLSLKDAMIEADNLGLKLDVIDSMYIKRMGRGLICKQEPVAGSKVKLGRRVLISINAFCPKMIPMPNLVGRSTREAIADIKAKGLTLGRLIYTKDLATNNVLSQLYKSQPIAAGTMIESSAEIDLLIGLNPDNDVTYIPDLKSYKYQEALDILHNSFLNIASISFPPTVKTYADSLNAVVVSQDPESSQDAVKMGTAVSLVMGTDKSE